jgi:hypothetical protein
LPAAELDEPPDGTVDEDSWGMPSSNDATKHHKPQILSNIDENVEDNGCAI